jgi:hypothetical protein
MTKFEEILTSSGESLLKMLYRSSADAKGGSSSSQKDYARNLRLTYAQLVCALGFNRDIHNLPDVIQIMGFVSYEALAKERDAFFTTDIYNRLGIKDVLAIYAHVPDDMDMLIVMQYLLFARLNQIEQRIEETVNSIVIERYKKEMRAIYHDGVAQIEFAEDRLNRTRSGFRALLNEVVMIVEARLIPTGDIFFRNTILPEEKRRLIIKGHIPKSLIEQRLDDDDVPAQERTMLEQQLERI